MKALTAVIALLGGLAMASAPADACPWKDDKRAEKPSPTVAS